YDVGVDLHALRGVVDRDVTTEVVRPAVAVAEQRPAAQLHTGVALEGGVAVHLGGAHVAAELGIADLELAGERGVDHVGVDDVGGPDRTGIGVRQVELAGVGDEAAVHGDALGVQEGHQLTGSGLGVAADRGSRGVGAVAAIAADPPLDGGVGEVQVAVGLHDHAVVEGAVGDDQVGALAYGHAPLDRGAVQGAGLAGRHHE